MFYRRAGVSLKCAFSVVFGLVHKPDCGTKHVLVLQQKGKEQGESEPRGGKQRAKREGHRGHRSGVSKGQRGH